MFLVVQVRRFGLPENDKFHCISCLFLVVFLWVVFRPFFIVWTETRSQETCQQHKQNNIDEPLHVAAPVRLAVLVNENRVAVRIRDHKTARALCRFVGLDVYLDAVGLQFFLQVADVREVGELAA